MTPPDVELAAEEYIAKLLKEFTRDKLSFANHDTLLIRQRAYSAFLAGAAWRDAHPSAEGLLRELIAETDSWGRTPDVFEQIKKRAKAILDKHEPKLP